MIQYLIEPIKQLKNQYTSWQEARGTQLKVTSLVTINLYMTHPLALTVRSKAPMMDQSINALLQLTHSL